MKTIKEAKLKNRTVLVRTDYNVPIKNGKIIDTLRIKASLPTLKYLREAGAEKIIIISHLGRPEGPNSELSLKKVATALSKMLPNVFFVNQTHGKEVSEAVKKLPTGGILLLENLRFSKDEEENSTTYAKSIIESTSADVFIQDGFAVTHRAHASTDAITSLVPSYAGMLLEKEITNLEKAIKNPERPMLTIIGGAKVKDKQPLIEKFSKIADAVAVGGKIAADGYKSQNAKIYVATDFDEDSTGAKLDIGPFSTAKIVDKIVDAKTIIWNGLLGYAEDPAYATASTIIAEALGEKNDATTIICGGDTTAFVETLTEQHPNLNYSLISTGGGAALEFLLGEKLPGIEALKRS